MSQHSNDNCAQTKTDLMNDDDIVGANDIIPEYILPHPALNSL